MLQINRLLIGSTFINGARLLTMIVIEYIMVYYASYPDTVAIFFKEFKIIQSNILWKNNEEFRNYE